MTYARITVDTEPHGGLAQDSQEASEPMLGHTEADQCKLLRPKQTQCL